MPMPQVGDVAPDFSLQDQHGNTVRLADHHGRPVVLYFYPKDDTPGCTVEACAFRDEYGVLSEAGVVVLGVSPDDTASHKRFADKFNLPFPLLADVGHALADTYGVWVEKNMYGKKSMGVQRATFLVGPDGTLQRVWPKVKAEGHAAEVREALRGVVRGDVPMADSKVPDTRAPDAPASSGARRTTSSPARKSATRKAAAKTGAARKTAAKKTAAKRGGARKTAAKKTAAKKTAAKKGAARKTATKKTAGARKAGATRRASARGGTVSPRGAGGALHKAQVAAARGRMKSGPNAPAGGAGRR